MDRMAAGERSRFFRRLVGRPAAVNAVEAEALSHRGWRRRRRRESRVGVQLTGRRRREWIGVGFVASPTVEGFPYS
jgi:hypothetical protein